MQATFDRLHAKDALTLATKTLANRPHVPTLAGVRVHADATAGTVTFTAHNLDAVTSATIPADVADGGTVLLPGKVVRDLVKTGADRVTVATDGDQVTFGPAVVRPLALADWPAPLAIPADDGTVWTADELDTLARVVPAAATEEARPMLTGVYFDPDGCAVATDSYRMHVGDLPAGSGPLSGRLVPSATVRQVVGWKTETVSVTAGTSTDAPRRDRMDVVRFDAVKVAGPVKRRRETVVTVTAGTIEAAFPAWSKLMPDLADTITVPVNGAAFVDAVKIVEPVTAGQVNTPITLAPRADGRLQLSAGGQEGAATAVLIESGPDVPSIAFNPRYLREVLTSTGVDTVAHFRDGLKPAVFVNCKVRCLLMPMRVN